MKKTDYAFSITCIGAALVLSAIVYAPMFQGKIPFPADYVFDFPAFAPLIPSYPLLPQTNIGDVVTSFYPYHTIAARAAREFSVPLWNPDMLSGAPFLAMAQGGVFYPANFFYYVLPVPLAWSIGFILRRILAAWFTALFIRRLGGTAAAAIASGLMFAFCGFLTAWQGQALSDSAIWLPLICYSVVRLRDEITTRSIAVAAFAFAMPVLAGHPETAAHLTITGVALALFLSIREPRFKYLKAFTLAGVLALGVAAVQILPTVEWLNYVHLPRKTPWPLPPLYSLLGLVSRDIIRAKTSIGLSMPEHAAYLAMTTFIAAPIAFLRREWRGVAIFFGLAAAAAMSAAYGVGPGHWIVSHVPGLNMLKNARLTLVASFSFTVLAGLGLSEVETLGFSDSKRRRFRALLLAAAGGAIAFMLIYLAHRIPVPEVIESVRFPRFGLLLLAAGSLVLALKVIGVLPRWIFAVLTVAIIGVDLGTVTYGAIPFTKVRDVFPSTPLLDNIPNSASVPFRVAQIDYAYGANYDVMYGRSALGGYEIPLERLKTFVSGVERNEPDSVILTSKGVLDSRDRRVDLLNAKYYVVSRWDPRYFEFRTDTERFRYLHTFGDTDVFENTRAFPRAFVVAVSGVEVIPDEAGQLLRVKDPAFDAEHHVILPAKPPLESPAALPSEARIQWRSFRQNDFEMDVATSEAGILVVSQIDYPGWKAYVDGRSVPLLRADYAFPAIVVTAGSHRVRFSFEPLTFKLGFVLSAISLVIAAMLGGRGTKQPNSRFV